MPTDQENTATRASSRRQISPSGSSVASTTSTTFKNTGLINGTAYVYTVAGRNVGGEGPRAVAVSATPLAPPAAGDVVDIELFLDDYRKVDGVLLPHHVTRSVAGEVSEEWTFASYQINPAFKPGTFEVK